jgi:hypothetical protein
VKSAAAAIALAIASLGAVARAEETPPAPRYPPSSVRPKLVAGGLALTASTYGVSLLCASTWPEVPGSDATKIPVAGPWIALAQNDCAADDPDCGFTLYFRGFLLILSGFAQAGGLGIAGEGLFMTTEAQRPTTERAASSVEVRPVPIVTEHATGLGLTGSF